MKYKKESSSFDSSLLLLWLHSVLGNISKSVLALFVCLTTAARIKHVLLSVSYDFLFSFFAHLLHKDCQVKLHSFLMEQKVKIVFWRCTLSTHTLCTTIGQTSNHYASVLNNNVSKHMLHKTFYALLFTLDPMSSSENNLSRHILQTHKASQHNPCPSFTLSTMPALKLFWLLIPFFVHMLSFTETFLLIKPFFLNANQLHQQTTL